ncbi:unnamed protein product [Sphenostylis stenocarpa]|uniref:Uncharacterized protein n=1 Tax=Sphenostylis stenocarpa TaxID=92480 RepID=A0AA86V769_9FABA|nr:unnamed protein product [Sphenostylis stenocarpa]
MVMAALERKHVAQRLVVGFYNVSIQFAYAYAYAYAYRMKEVRDAIKFELWWVMYIVYDPKIWVCKGYATVFKCSIKQSKAHATQLIAYHCSCFGVLRLTRAGLKIGFLAKLTKVAPKNKAIQIMFSPHSHRSHSLKSGFGTLLMTNE